MPLQSETAYPQLKAQLSERELREIYTPTPHERLLAEQYTNGKPPMVAFLVLLKTFQRTAKRIRAEMASAIHKQIDDTITERERDAIDRLFLVDLDTGKSPWNQLKTDPENPTLSHFEELMEQATWLTGLQISTDTLAGIPEVKIQRFATEALALDANRMKDMQVRKRHTLALSLLRVQRAQALDDVAEMFTKRLRHRSSSRDAKPSRRIN